MHTTPSDLVADASGNRLPPPSRWIIPPGHYIRGILFQHMNVGVPKYFVCLYCDKKLFHLLMRAWYPGTMQVLFNIIILFFNPVIICQYAYKSVTHEKDQLYFILSVDGI